MLKVRRFDSSCSDFYICQYVISLGVLIFAVLVCNPAFAKSKKPKTPKSKLPKYAAPFPCSARMKVEQFFVSGHGQISNVGKSEEGPLCIVTHFDPISVDFVPNSATSYSAGPDASAIILTGAASPPSVHLPAAAPSGMPDNSEYEELRNSVHGLQQSIKTVTTTLTDLQGMRVKVDTLLLQENVVAIPQLVLSSYTKSLGGKITAALSVQDDFLATDLASGVCPSAPLPSPQQGSLAQRVAQYKAKNFAPGTTYTPEQLTSVNALFNDTQSLTCGSSALTQLTTQLASVAAFNFRLQLIGLVPNQDPPSASDLAAHFVEIEVAKCGNIFNQSSSTVYSATIFDQSAYLTGQARDTNGHTVNSMLTVTCASPISISAGVEFSTIPNIEYAIVKSKNTTPISTTSVNQFQATVDSSVHPLPVALAHVRLWDSPGHKHALHFTAGASGNLQSQNAGGSSAEFLIGGSYSLFRTVYVSLGLHIGTKTTLAGGFKPGDDVPSDITDMSQVQLNKSYQPGFGFALTFTKP